jgi:hypothetical protein
VAPVLQCPECGTTHPLTGVPNEGTFPCRGCGRMLKVPELVPRTARSSAPPAAPTAPPPPLEPDVEPDLAEPLTRAAPSVPPPTPSPAATRAMPPAARDTPAAAVVPPPILARNTVLAPVPMWARFALWLVAVPLAFFIVFAFARGVGLFTSDQQADVFLAKHLGRFWPVIRLLPFVALLTAALVHGGVYGLARWRGRHSSR